LSDHRPDGNLPEGGRSRRESLRRLLLIAAGMFVAGYAVVALAMVITSPRRTVITVPDVRWMPERQARRILDAAELGFEIGDSIPNPTVAAGAIIAQSPLPSQEVGPGSRVRVIVSSGVARRTVPDVSMLSRDQAARVLTATGFRVQITETKNLRAAGRVLGTEPARGTSLPASAVVKLLVSAGPPMVAVPTLVGAREEQIDGLLDAAGLRTGTLRRVFDLDGPAGIVLSQSPAPGDSIRMGAAVSAVISSSELPGRPVDEPAPASPPEEQ
jgi:serine/threonine-protein kinase